MSEWLTVREVMAESRLGYTTVLEKIRKGELKATRLAHKILVSRTDLADWFERGRILPKQTA